MWPAGVATGPRNNPAHWIGKCRSWPTRELSIERDLDAIALDCLTSQLHGNLRGKVEEPRQSRNSNAWSFTRKICHCPWKRGIFRIQELHLSAVVSADLKQGLVALEVWRPDIVAHEQFHGRRFELSQNEYIILTFFLRDDPHCPADAALACVQPPTGSAAIPDALEGLKYRPMLAHIDYGELVKRATLALIHR
jgi:hypothetical protein